MSEKPRRQFDIGFKAPTVRPRVLHKVPVSTLAAEFDIQSSGIRKSLQFFL